METIELKEKAQKILETTSIETFIGDDEILKILKDIKDNDIQNEDMELLSKSLCNIEKYLFTKAKMSIQEKDFEYLRNIAHILREQNVRAEDGVVFGSPVFTIKTNKENDNETVSFLTRDGVDVFVDANSTTLQHLPIERKEYNENSEEKRKDKLYVVEKNTNLELEKIIEIIKRNF